jgi:hypothetical protein
MSTTPIRTKRKRWSPSDGKASKATVSISKKPSSKDAPAAAKAESASEPIAEPKDMGNAGGAEASAPLGEGAAAAAQAAPAAAAGGAGAAGAIGGGLTSRMPTPTRGPGLIEMAPPPEMLFDPKPMAANRFTVGNASRGNINLGGLWGGAKPNPAYDPSMGPAPGNLPYLGTEGFVGGVKRLFAGNNANELNASALQQSNGMRQWMWQQQAARQLDAGRDMSVNRDAAATDLQFKPQIAGKVAEATGVLDQTKAQTQATIDANNREEMTLPFDLDQRAAQTGLTMANTGSVLGNEQRDRGMYDSRLAYQLSQTRNLDANTNETERLIEPRAAQMGAQTDSIRAGTQTENDMRTPRVNLTNAQTTGLGADTDRTKLQTQQMGNLPRVEGGMIIDPVTGRVSTMGTPGLPAQYQPQLQTIVPGRVPMDQMGDAPPEFFDQGPPAGQPVPLTPRAAGGTPEPAPIPPVSGGSRVLGPAPSTNAPAPVYAPTGSRQWLAGIGRSAPAYDPSQDTAAQQGQMQMNQLLELARAAAAARQRTARQPAFNFGQ